MRHYTIILCLSAFVLAGCSKRVLTVDNTADRSRERETVGGELNREVAFVTSEEKVEKPRTAEKESIQNGARARRERELSSLKFSDNETLHVRIVQYDPFGGSDVMSIDLDEAKEEFIYPYDGKLISNYGYRGRSPHTGVDIKAIPNDTIRSILDGVVRMSRNYSGYGNIVVIRHANGLESAYAHNSRNLVQPNDFVRAGQPIGLAGRTGRATTEHLHFELRIIGEHFDPNLMLDTENRTIKPGVITISRTNGRLYVTNSISGRSASEIEPTQPVAVNTSSGQTASPSKTTSSSSTAPGTVHSVKKGDTLYSISKRYGTTIDKLCQLNGISRNGVLSIGQKIRVK